MRRPRRRGRRPAPGIRVHIPGPTQEAGTPADGTFDFRFRLFNTPTGGAPFGQALCVDNVFIADGLFTTELDFGQQFANPNPRYIEIEVRADAGLNCGNETGFVVLAPRQRLTGAPRAHHARSSSALTEPSGAEAVIVDLGGNVGIGTLDPMAKLDVRGGPLLVENIGEQADLLWLASERSWVFRQEGTGAATALKLQSIGGGGNKNLVVQTDGFMGVGTTSPQAKLDVRGDIRLGPSGQFQAAAASENLRMLRGSVQTTGAPFSGSGWSSSRIGTGRYSIVYNTPFADAPTVVASGASSAVIVVTVSNDNGAGCHLVARNADGVATDASVRFVAVGAR